jgi:hypothetical protein
MSIGSPFEKFNVFDEDIQKELEARRLSDNLVEIRTPFLRYTTTVEFPTAQWYTDLAKKAGATDAFNYIAPYDLGRYAGCKFFTLGVHGLDDDKSLFDSMYGVQDNSGLIVGTTYSQEDNTQRLVRTSQFGNSVTKLDQRFDSPQSYPPPGIESATVERLRNGNVLKFMVNVVCYTKQQLDMLELLAFSPGMTCVLEWGNLISTPFGEKGLRKDRILNFRNVRDTELGLDYWIKLMTGGLRRRGASKGARSLFIDAVCKPNNYHYDYAIARIANVKTEVANNKYSTTVIAYGVADNIMHISAYATNNSDFAEEPNNKENTYITSIREYFAPRSKFNYLLNNMVQDTQIVKFDEPDNANEVTGPGAAAGAGTPTNDLGQEQTFYITLKKFIEYFINNPEDGVAKIVNASLNISDSVNTKNNRNDSVELLVDVTDLKIGYNELLRSTDPSTILIVNKRAMDRADISKTVKEYLNTQTQKVQTSNNKKPLVSKIEGNQFLQVEPDGNPSGVASAATGIWLNSKMIQEVFLQARTFHEAMETILNRINSATEGYWDLGLMYDEEYSAFRIVDGNLKEFPKAPQKIYTFNKRLPNNPTSQGVEGPEVLDIKINMDYPKLLISQLGISALSNSSGNPDRKDLNFARNPLLGPRLWDIFRKEQPFDKSRSKTQQTPPPSNVASKVDEFVKSTLKNSLYDDVRTNLTRQLNIAGFDTLPINTRQALTSIFSIQRPLTQDEARGFLNIIQSDDLTISQVNAIKVVLGLRSEAIIKQAKKLEYNSWDGFEFTLARVTKADVSNQIKTVKNNIKNSETSLLNLINGRSASTVQPPPNQNELRPNTQPAGGLPGAIR